MKEIKLKSGHELITFLTDEEKLNFIEELINAKRSVEQYLDDEYECFQQFIGQSFIFLESIQGAMYWIKIHTSNRDGANYNAMDSLKSRDIPSILFLKLFFSRGEDASITDNENDDLDSVLSELNIKKQKSKMTKLTLDINPYLRAVNVSAKINGLEERNEFNYESFDNDFSVFFMLGDIQFKANFSYTDELHVEVFDEDNVAVPFKLKTSK